jgi:hypothetical protein
MSNTQKLILDDNIEIELNKYAEGTKSFELAIVYFDDVVQCMMTADQMETLGKFLIAFATKRGEVTNGTDR